MSESTAPDNPEALYGKDTPAEFEATDKSTLLNELAPMMAIVHSPLAGLLTLQLISEPVLVTEGHFVAPVESVADMVTFPVPPDSLTDKVFNPAGKVNVKFLFAPEVPDRAAE